MTEPQLGGTYSQLLALARWAETNGLHSFARSDHYYSTRHPTPAATDALATLAGLARDTRTIRLCVLVTPLSFRHPAVIAKNAATIDEMSDGRLDLGIGTGWMEEEHTAFGLDFVDWSERYARLEEGIAYLKAAFSADHSRFEGRYYRLDATVLPNPSGLRLIVGGSGPRRTPALAGREADEYNCLIQPPDQIAERIAVMREAADGRPVTATVMGPALVGEDLADYRRRLSAAAARRGLEPDQLEDRFSSAGIPVGTPDRVAEAIRSLGEAGVERYYLQWLDLEDFAGLEIAAEEIAAA